MPKRRTRGLDITKEDVLAQLIYDESRGTFFRRAGRYAGNEAKNLTPDGFATVSLDGISYAAHHLVWLMHHGSYPKSVVVHVNEDRLDNRFGNLVLRDIPPNRNRRAAKHVLSHERLTELLEYNPNTGVFVWKKSLGCRGAKAGAIAGHLCKSSGYMVVTIDWVTHAAHRLAWFYVHKKWPELEIDHRNRNRSDNSMLNLREADEAQQSWNSSVRSDSSTGITGVSKLKDGSGYRAYIQKHGSVKYLGNYSELQQAKAVRRDAEIEQFGEFAKVS